jgi:hypothetical protein
MNHSSPVLSAEPDRSSMSGQTADTPNFRQSQLRTSCGWCVIAHDDERGVLAVGGLAISRRTYGTPRIRSTSA